MLFNSIPYMLFLPAVLLVYYPLPNRLKPIWLLLCSYFFYMCWNARYLVLILTSTLVTWVCGLAIEKAENSGAEDAVRIRRKKAAVVLGLVINLGILFFFKYFHFAMDNLAVLLALAHVSFQQPAFDVLLPVGISFYTFQALGYMIDVYRGDIAAEGDQSASDAMCFVFTSDLEPLPACSHAFALTEEGVYERSDY